MRIISSSSGKEQCVSVRRSESSDAEGISDLICSSTVAVFGRINVIHLLEKANLAVTVTNAKAEIVAQASFLDYPIGALVDQSQWETFLHKHFTADTCTPINTLFLHLFVAQEDFATECMKEILRAVFNAVTELEQICLLSPYLGSLEGALEVFFEPMGRVSEAGSPKCLSLICHRRDHCQRLHIRPARVEDHDDIMTIFSEQTKVTDLDRPFFLAGIIEAQGPNNYTAVCESDGVAVGFISGTSDVNLDHLQDNFDLTGFNCFYKQTQTQTQTQTEPKSDPGAAEEEEEEEEEITETQPTDTHQEERKSNAFCIQLLAIDKNYEMRSVDFIPYLFDLFPALDYCVITLPTLCPELSLLHSFLRVPPRPGRFPLRELYVFHRPGLMSVNVRRACEADRQAVCELVEGLTLNEFLLKDLDHFYETRTDQEGVPLQAFVAQVQSDIVGIVIIRNEQEVEYTRAHYNIENFIYFSHHRYEEHAQIGHFVLRPSFKHFGRHLFKDILRLGHKSCLYHQVYPPHLNPQNSCIPRLDFLLDCAVPVRPRRQIEFPLDELDMNAPSGRITQEQQHSDGVMHVFTYSCVLNSAQYVTKNPFSLSMMSRKLTLEPKVTVNARIVVVGASDTALSFLQVLCLCPHLRFNNLTLISTHCLSTDIQPQDTGGFLSTSHAFSGPELSRLPFDPCITMVTGKMVAINRHARFVCVSGGRTVPYDHLILCTGLQYQVPRPTGVDLSRPITTSDLPASCCQGRYTGSVPANMFTLNCLQDCVALRGWMEGQFIGTEDNAIVYGNSIDVYTSVEALLTLGIVGNRIHLVLTPTKRGDKCFKDPVVEEAVISAMKKAKVNVYSNCMLAQMNTGEHHPDPLTSVAFTTDEEPLYLQCGVFINLSNKGVDLDAFQSINNSFLVFDRRLVINGSFFTCDPVISGAGPVAKFSRCYHADEWSHGNFSSTEVGRELAAKLMPLFDPTLEPPPSTPTTTRTTTTEEEEEEEEDRANMQSDMEMERLVPLYKQAKIQGGKLPGGFHYLCVSKPSPTTPADQHVKTLQDNGIATGHPDTGNYFCVQLDTNEVVEGLTCLSAKPRPFSNYLSLFGKHQQLLGQLSNRYYQGLTRDLYSFFSQGWSMAIYHDRFSDFEQELLQITSATECISPEEEEEEEEPEEEEEDPEHPRQSQTLSPTERQAVRASTVRYLTYNRNLLTMFAVPGQM